MNIIKKTVLKIHKKEIRQNNILRNIYDFAEMLF